MPIKRPYTENTQRSKRTFHDISHWIEVTFSALTAESLANLKQKLPGTISLAHCDQLLDSIRIAIRTQTFAGLESLLMRVFTDLNYALANQTEVEQWLYFKIKPDKSIGFLLRNLGLLANAKYKHELQFPALPPIAADSIIALLNKINPRTATCILISNSLNGLGLLAEAKKIDRTIHCDSLIPVLEKLLRSPSIDAQAITNCLYTLGRLAEKNLLLGSIDKNTSIIWLKKLLDCQFMSSQSISNSLYALSRLAINNHLEGDLSNQALSLLEALTHCQNIAYQDIGNSFHALNILWRSKNLQRTIDSRIIILLLKKVGCSLKLEAQAIGNSLYTLGHLAQDSKIQGKIDYETLIPLLTTLSNKDLNRNAKSIAYSLAALSRLVENDRLAGYIDSYTLHSLLEVLLGCQDISNETAKSLFSLARLAEFKKITGDFKNETFVLLFKKLLEYPTAHSLSKSLTALGHLLENELLQDKINSHDVIIPLLNALLNCQNITAPSLTSCLNTLGRLTESNKLLGEIDSNILALMYDILVDCPDIDGQAISNGLLALGRLVTKKKTSLNSLLSNSVHSLLNKFFTLSSLTAMHSYQVLMGLEALLEQGLITQQAVSSLELERLVKIALTSSYLHPSFAAKFIHVLALFGYSNPSLAQTFETLLSELEGINFQDQYPELKDQLEADVKALNQIFARQQPLHPNLGANLEPNPTPPPIGQPVTNTRATSNSPSGRQTNLLQTHSRPRNGRSARIQLPLISRPTSASVFNAPQEQWQAASQNLIFDAIAQSNLNGLRQALQVYQPLPSERRRNSSSRPQPARGTEGRRFHSTVETKLEAQNVIAFLTTTNAQALRQLISQSNSKYFELLLEVLTEHQRYQLAKQENHPLHPIFLYLPLNELKLLIEVIISPFQIYRDSQALLAVLDALSLRFHQRLDEQKDIHALQTKLIDRGLQFHTNHHRVFPCLVAKKRRLGQYAPNIAGKAITLSGNAAVSSGRRAPIVSRPQPITTPQPPARASAAEGPQPDAAAPRALAIPTPLIQETRKPKEDYCYTSEDINRLLLLRLDQNKYLDVHILAAVCLNDGVEGNRLKDLLDLFFGANHLPPQTPQTVLIPIQIGEHWVGLSLIIKQQTICALTYYNSLRSAGDQGRMNTILFEIKQTGFASEALNINFAEHDLQQPDDKSCGPFLVENLVRDVKDRGWEPPQNGKKRQELMLAIRQFHWNILEQKDPSYFKNFQEQTNTVLPLSRQAANQNAFFSSPSRVSPARGNIANQELRL